MHTCKAGLTSYSASGNKYRIKFGLIKAILPQVAHWHHQLEYGLLFQPIPVLRQLRGEQLKNKTVTI